MRRYKILIDERREGQSKDWEMICPKCGVEQILESKGPMPVVIATSGLAFITDPPDAEIEDGALPATIQCRFCRAIFDSRSDEEIQNSIKSEA